jgi:oxygen-dependent protoporphyrinogen oxidase
MEMKRIAIVGGGISGLAVLHYLKKRFSNDLIAITLYEREEFVGGTIRSLQKGPCLFEWGPNAFLDNQPDTLQLIAELGLTDQLITAGPNARRCYIQIKGKLKTIPANSVGFIFSSLLPLKDKFFMIAGIFKKNVSEDCSIHAYASKRFSYNIAESLVDPLMNGIYAGNIKRLHMASAFPKIDLREGKKPRMHSFKFGMGQMVETLAGRYQKHIRTNFEINSDSHYLFDANVTIMATPAYVAAKIVENINPYLSTLLDQAPYAPIAVAALLFKRNAFKKKPDGLGFLVPSQENKDILGVLLESNVFPQRAGDNQIMMRVMLGGAHHPAIINDDPQQVLSKAIREIDSTYGLLSNPQKTFVKIWPKAIPQYEVNYPQWRRSVQEQSAKTPGLYLCANYLDGVSFNDCIRNAKTLAVLVNI